MRFYRGDQVFVRQSQVHFESMRGFALEAIDHVGTIGTVVEVYDDQGVDLVSVQFPDGKRAFYPDPFLELADNVVVSVLYHREEDCMILVDGPRLEEAAAIVMEVSGMWDTFYPEQWPDVVQALREEGIKIRNAQFRVEEAT